jgi:hypothetical protein
MLRRISRHAITTLAIATTAPTACVDMDAVQPEPSQSFDTSPTAGGWTLTSTPSPSNNGNTLRGITATSPVAIWAVGDRETGTGTNTLVQRFDGTNWQVVASPNPGAVRECGYGNVLTDVAASGNDVWAVGYFWSCTVFRPLTLRWTGTSWQRLAAPTPNGSGNTSLEAVAVRQGDAWAVGSYVTTTDAVLPLIIRWNGTAWTRIPAAPLPNVQHATLRAVAIASENDVWAAGTMRNPTSNRMETLIQRWNGTTWTVVPSPNPSLSGANTITALAVVSPTDVWAVGDFEAWWGGRVTLTLRWDGATWRVVQSPNATANYGASNVLDAVVAAGAEEVWAMGHFEAYQTGLNQRSLTMRWNGTTWSIVPSPAPGQAASLTSATVVGGQVWAAGVYSLYGSDPSYGFFTAPRTLVIRR